MSEALAPRADAPLLWPGAIRPASARPAATLNPDNGLARLLDSLSPRPRADEPALPPSPDIEALHAAAYAAGEAAGHAAGNAAGSAAAEARLAPLRADLAEATAALHAACAIDAAALAPLLADLVRALAETVLAGELARPQALLPLAEAALALVAPAAAPTLCAHPETLVRLAPHLPGLATTADAALPPGVFHLAGADFVVPVDLPQRLAAVLADLA
jgi:hypothetical protein